jgi:hypothetical protein
MVDAGYLREHYDKLTDEELERIAKSDLVSEARAVLEAEFKSRGLALPAGGVLPYAPPAARVEDPDAWATLTVGGLIRLFQAMAIASTALGMFLTFWPLLPIPISEPLAEYRAQTGDGALAPWFSHVVWMALQPLWIVSALGLCFFKWWARPVFAGTYVLSAVGNLAGGVIVWLPWEAVLVTVATLLDGAVLVLAFLPPLSKYFERDRQASPDRERG